MVEKCANDWNIGLCDACYEGHKERALLMIEKGADYWNYGLREACEGGHKELVLLMIEKGANVQALKIRINWLQRNKDLYLMLNILGAPLKECFIYLTVDDYIYLFHKNIRTHENEEFMKEVKLYQERKQGLLLNFEDIWLKMSLEKFL